MVPLKTFGPRADNDERDRRPAESAKNGPFQGLRETGATGLEPATSGVTGVRRPSHLASSTRQNGPNKRLSVGSGSAEFRLIAPNGFQDVSRPARRSSSRSRRRRKGRRVGPGKPAAARDLSRAGSGSRSRLSTGPVRDRQREGNRRPPIFPVLGPDAAAVSLDEAPGDGESQTGAAARACAVAAPETV